MRNFASSRSRIVLARRSRALGLESTFVKADSREVPARKDFSLVLSFWDSGICVFVCVDCHATACAVSRNDRK